MTFTRLSSREIVAEVDGPGAFNECLEDNNETALTTLCAGLS